MSSVVDPPHASSDSAVGSGLSILEASPQPELTAEQEAALDADPRHRLYDMNKIEAPSMLGPTLGAFTKLVLLTGREDLPDFAVEYFEQLKLARAADPRMDGERFLAAQLKVLQKKSEPHTYDLESAFDAPEALSVLLLNFSREVIRFQPADLFGFALDYFTTMSEQGDVDMFLDKQRRLADDKQKLWEADKQRTHMAKERKAQKEAAADDDNE